MGWDRISRLVAGSRRLGLGTAALGMAYGIEAPGAPIGPSEVEVERVLHRAVDAGIRWIDTAPAYGEAETRIGGALADRRDEIFLATKVEVATAADGRPDGESAPRRILESVERSRSRLRCDTIDLLQIHNATARILEDRALTDALVSLRERGIVRALGATTYGEEDALAVLEQGSFDTIQVAYSVFDRRMEREVLPRATARGIGVVLRSILLKGAATERAESLPEHLAPLRERSREFRRIVAGVGDGWTAASAALRFTLGLRDVAVVLVGVASLTELEEVLEAVERPEPAPPLRERLSCLALQDPALVDPRFW